MRSAAMAGRHAHRQDFATLLMIGLCLAGLALIAAGAAIPVKASVAQLMLERAFDRSLAAHRPLRPWPWADMAPVARIAVPRLGLDRIVLDGGSGQAMAFAPTLLPGGARIGATGTIVLAAHRDTHFRFFARLRPGDLIELRGLDGVLRRYAVTGAEIVRWDAYAVAAPDRSEKLDLTTCYPFAALFHGPLRYVVHAAAIGSADARSLP